MNRVGKEGEETALLYLKKEGYRIIATNYKTGFGEVDIIALDRHTTVFVEVKTRSNSAFGYPFEAVTPNKQKKMKKLALYYMKQQRKELPLRFDVLSISVTGSQKQVEHIRDAFEV